MNARRLLTLNAGSSSLKFAIYDVNPSLSLKLSGQVSGLDTTPQLRVFAEGGLIAEASWPRVQGLDEVLLRTFTWLDASGWGDGIDAVGHRIVHGGLEYSEPTRLSGEVLQRLGALAHLAPLHQPHNLRGVAQSTAHFPTVSTACLTTTSPVFCVRRRGSQPAGEASFYIWAAAYHYAPWRTVEALPPLWAFQRLMGRR